MTLLFHWIHGSFNSTQDLGRIWSHSRATRTPTACKEESALHHRVANKSLEVPSVHQLGLLVQVSQLDNSLLTSQPVVQYLISRWSVYIYNFAYSRVIFGGEFGRFGGVSGRIFIDLPLNHCYYVVSTHFAIGYEFSICRIVGAFSIIRFWLNRAQKSVR